MPYEVVGNNAQSTMNNGGTMSSGATTVTLTSVSSFPTTANFRILIDSELMLVTGISGSQFTVTRGIEGTSAASHADGSTVTHVLTKGGLTQLMADRTLRGVRTSLPAAGVAGRWYYCSDCPFKYYDNGTTWQKYFGGYPVTEVPASTSFTVDNSTGLTFSAAFGMLNLKSSGASSSQNWEYCAAPGSTPWSLRTAILRNPIDSTDSQNIFGVRNSGGAYTAMYIEVDSGVLKYNVGEWNSATSFHSTVWGNYGFYSLGGLVFIKVQDDGTNINWSLSQDGINFTPAYSQGRTSWLSGGPNAIAIGVYSGSDASSVSFIDWTPGV